MRGRLLLSQQTTKPYQIRGPLSLSRDGGNKAKGWMNGFDVENCGRVGSCLSFPRVCSAFQQNHAGLCEQRIRDDTKGSVCIGGFC